MSRRTRRFNIPILMTTGVLGGGGAAFTYYVDSVSGNDANTGRSEAQAFQTLSALPALQTGESVGLVRGSEWREQLTVTAANVTIAAIGDGIDPHLRADDIAPNASFTKTGGQTNVYQISVSPDLASSKTWVNAWEDDVYLVRASSIANCDATPGSYYPSADTGSTPITLYVHASDSSDVTANGKVYEYTSRRYGLYAFAADNITVDGITTSRNLHEDGSTVVKRATLRNCQFNDGSKHNILCGDGSLLEDCSATEAYYAGLGTYLYVYNEDTPAGLGIIHRRCTASNSVYRTNVSAFYGHINTSGDFGAVIYEDCETDNMFIAFAAGSATSMVYTRPVCRNTATFLRVACADTVVTDPDVILTNTLGGQCRGIEMQATALEVQVSGGSILADTPNTGLVVNLFSNSVMRFTDTLLHVTVSGVPIFSNSGLTGVELHLLRTSLVSPNSQLIRVLGTLAAYVADYVCYDYNSGSFACYYNGTGYGTLAGWRTLLSQDVNSSVGGCL